MKQCQWLVDHHDPYTHSMSDHEEQCRRKGVEERTISSGKTVVVCRQHAKMIDYRLGSNFFRTPDKFFVWEE